MPFMIGRSAIRRTTQYLEAGRVVFRESVKIFSVNLSLKGDHHEGARDFVYWYFPQIQYKNPNVQCLTFNNLTPTPFIRIYLEDTRSVLIDIDSRDKKEILDHLANFSAICKQPIEIATEKREADKKENYSYFGSGCKRHCMCEVLGQIPCPRLVLLPKSWRARGKPVKKMAYRIPLPYMEPELKDEDEDED